MKSRTRFILKPWLFILFITIITVILSSFSITNELLVLLLLIPTFIALFLLPYSMLTLAPKYPYCITPIYILLIWIMLKVSNSDHFSMNSITFSGLTSTCVMTLLAMAIFYRKNKTQALS